jgi:hypothetical protein
MASILSAGTTSATALNMSADTSGILQLASNNGTVALTVNTSQNVGIGIANPDVKLAISSGATLNSFRTVTTGTNTYTPTASTSLVNANWFAQGVGASGACTGIRFSQGANFELFLGGVQETGGAAAFVFQGFNGTSYEERMRIESTGNVGIGGLPSSYKLHVLDQFDRAQNTSQISISGSGYQGFHFLDGSAYYIGQNSNSRDLRIYSGGSTAVGVRLTPGNNAWQTYSDERMKDIIEPIENALAKVLTLRTVIGKYKTDEDGKRRVMMIAQDVKAVLPEATTEDAEGMLGMAYDHIVPLLTAAIQELSAKVTALENK